MSSEVNKLIKSAILGVLKEEKQKQLNEFNPDTGRLKMKEGCHPNKRKLRLKKFLSLENIKSLLHLKQRIWMLPRIYAI